jgi:hypothetical protein
MQRLPDRPHVAISRITGRSLAMGGLALVALLQALGPGQKGLHLAASPEGPHFAIELTGGPAV